MARRKAQATAKHPYERFEGSREWILLEQGLKNLVENGDIQVSTHHSHVLGHLCQVLDTTGRIADPPMEAIKGKRQQK